MSSIKEYCCKARSVEWFNPLHHVPDDGEMHRVPVKIAISHRLPLRLGKTKDGQDTFILRIIDPNNPNIVQWNLTVKYFDILIMHAIRLCRELDKTMQDVTRINAVLEIQYIGYSYRFYYTVESIGCGEVIV